MADINYIRGLLNGIPKLPPALVALGVSGADRFRDDLRRVLVACFEDALRAPAEEEEEEEGGSVDLSAAWPIGSIFLSAVSTNPGTLLGFGTWVAFAAGRALVGIDAGQTEFDTLLETGGAKTHTLLTAEMPSHTHTQDAHNHTQDSHNHTQDAHTHTQNAHTHTQDAHTHTQNAHAHVQQIRNSGTAGTAGTQGASQANQVSVGTTDNTTATNQNATAVNQNTTAVNQNATATNQATTATNQAATATNQNAGGGGAHNNLQPYIVVYMWRRTA